MLGLRALRFLAAAPDAFERFLTVSGTDAESLRQCASEPEWLAAVLDFLLANEGLLVQFCEGEGIDARTVHLSAARLAR